MIGTLILFVTATVIVVGIVCYGFGYHDAMKKAGDMLDSAIENKFKNAGIVMKKDDRIIECNGMMIPMQCEKCRFGRVKKDSVECFVPDFDGVTTVGIKNEYHFRNLQAHGGAAFPAQIHEAGTICAVGRILLAGSL